MEKPKIDQKLTLLTEFGKTEAICAEVLENPANAEGVLLKVMARGPFREGDQCWIVDRDGSIYVGDSEAHRVRVIKSGDR